MDLGALLPGASIGPVVGKGREAQVRTPLVEATVEFLREFEVEEREAGKGKGKGRDEREEEELDSFIPTKVYDAMKEKKRFDNMRVSFFSFPVDFIRC